MTKMPDDVQAYSRTLIAEFRANGAPAGRPLLLLTTKGARSGEQRTAPMMYVPDGDRLLVIASNAGAPRHPAWYHNIVADPTVTVEVGADVYRATAIVTAGEERDRLFAMISEKYPFFAGHQAGTSRSIPVVALERIIS